MKMQLLISNAESEQSQYQVRVSTIPMEVIHDAKIGNGKE